MLDESMRERLRDLAQSDEERLDDEAVERIVETVGREGPGIVRRARMLRTGAWVGALAAAAAVAFVVTGPDIMSEPGAKTGVAKDLRRCLELPEPEVGEDTIDFGWAGRATYEGELTVEGTGCERVLRLGEGRVRVEADDLGGGDLRVVAGGTEVTVWGTIFTVRRMGDAVEVEVEEGRVHVVGDGWRRRLRAGQRVSDDGLVAPLGVVTARLDATEEATSDAPSVTTAAGAPSAMTPSALSADELVLQAETLRAQRDFEGASHAYRAAGRMTGATAEAAWLALARMDEARGRSASALAALRNHRRRFPGGALGAEVAGLGFRIARNGGRADETRRYAELLVSGYPNAPQSAAARRWLDAHP